MQDELIARLEAATEGSRELDREIAERALGWRPALMADGSPSGWMATPNGIALEGGVPKFTTSFDAAMQLVPEGWDWGRDEDGRMFVRELSWPAGMPGPITFTTRERDWTAPPALALCIASLKALAGTD